jgi:hypothetical protein
MLYLLRILRKCKKLKNKYIIVMSSKDTKKTTVDSKPVVSETVDSEDIELAEATEEKEALIKKFNDELETFKKELHEWQKRINNIYEKIEKEKETGIKITDQEHKDLAEYETLYKEYTEILNALSRAQAEDEPGFFATLVTEPISKFFSGIGDKITNGTAKGLTGTFTFWTNVAAKSMEQMQESLEKIQEIKAKIAAAGKRAQAEAEAGIQTGTPETVEGLPETVEGLPETTKGLPTTIKVGGGRYSNIKEVQKGGAAAAKRAQDSIKQFLSSSVTSSHILNMVKRKTKAKRKRNEKRSRYSRKRAKK